MVDVYRLREILAEHQMSAIVMHNHEGVQCSQLYDRHPHSNLAFKRHWHDLTPQGNLTPRKVVTGRTLTQMRGAYSDTARSLSWFWGCGWATFLVIEMDMVYRTHRSIVSIVCQLFSLTTL